MTTSEKYKVEAGGGAVLAVVGRIVVWPLALLIVFTSTGYLSHANVLKLVDESIYAFTEQDPVMAGGCTGCFGLNKICLVKYSIFAQDAIIGATVFKSYAGRKPDLSLYDFSSLSKEALELGERLDAKGLFPYNFESSIPRVERSAPAGTTKYGFETVLQPLFKGYYGGCRVRVVNTTGVYVEDTCEASKRWSSYGLMIHSPDDIPMCSTGDVCIHNYYNSIWEWVSYIDVENPTRIGMNLNTFRSRYGDTVALSVLLPGIVVMQMLIMGRISLYQVMSHKRSVLLTQIWAYRCQNGRMQVVYLAQITYHLVYNSDLYMLGLATGMLTIESVMNLTCCIFAFSYAFVNLAKARSGDQQLDRHFRLTWETMQIVITSIVAAVLLSLRQTPLEFINANYGEILRKTSARGAKYCGLNDSCVVYKTNLVVFITIFSIGLGIFAAVSSLIVKRLSPKVKSAPSAAVAHATDAPIKKKSVNEDGLTSFERNCIGRPFRTLFRDCDDMAYIMYKGKRCTTVEALLLTGYLYYGEHIYQASSVMLLLLARALPRKMLRTFNMLLLRWHVDKDTGVLTQG
ncbi:hypothetical protein PInf_005825 [Phytophthora infestans]|nr:hypothetical protein PInf_005825 [Phytophthora infestans]